MAIRIQTWWRVILAKKRLKRIMKARKVRDQVARELLSTEKNYVESLEVVVERFLHPLLADPRFDKKKIRAIFSEIEMIKNFNKTTVLAELQARMATYDPAKTILGDVFDSLTVFLRASYTSYVNNFDNGAMVLKSMLASDPEFAKAIKEMESKPECKGLTLSAFLIMPIQRLPRYKLLMEELVKSTPDDHVDFKALKKALENVAAVAMHVNEKKRIQEGLGRLLELQSSLFGWDNDLVSPGRTLIKEGAVFDEDGNEDYLILLSDYLLVTKRSVNTGAGRTPASGASAGTTSTTLTTASMITYKYKLTVAYKIAELVEVAAIFNHSEIEVGFVVGTMAEVMMFQISRGSGKEREKERDKWVEAINGVVRIIRNRMGNMRQSVSVDKFK